MSLEISVPLFIDISINPLLSDKDIKKIVEDIFDNKQLFNLSKLDVNKSYKFAFATDLVTRTRFDIDFMPDKFQITLYPNSQISSVFRFYDNLKKYFGTKYKIEVTDIDYN